MLLPTYPPLAPYGFDTTHHGGGARAGTFYEDLCPKTLEAFHKAAFDVGYEVRRRETKEIGPHYAALDTEFAPPRIMGIYPNLTASGARSFTPMLLVLRGNNTK